MKDWLEKSSALLRQACIPQGIRASLTTKENYGGIFTRDAVMAGIVGILLKDSVIIQGLHNTLLHLRELQGAQGQIPSNFQVENQQITKVSFGTLSPKIDSCTWYLIGVGLLIKEDIIDKSTFRESVTRTIELLNGIEFNGKHLMYIPKGGNWADEYVYEGYILYDQVLRSWGLQLLSEIYGQLDWYNKSKAITQTLTTAYPNERMRYYNSSFYPGGIFSKFDLPAHTLAGIILNKDNRFFSEILDWLSSTFLAKAQLPPVFFPVIDEGDSYWDNLNQYHLYRFKNKPHHFHNGGIWWIWLGWLSVSLSLWDKEAAVQQLTQTAFEYLERQHADFAFDEYISGDELALAGTKQLVFTASGIALLSLASSGSDFSMLNPATSSTIKEPLEIKKAYFTLSKQVVDHIAKATLFDRDKLVITVAGESGSGKSVTAKCLQIELEKRNIHAVIIHQDGYYHLPPKENHARRKADIGWVGPEELQLNLMQQHIQQFKAGAEMINVPVINYMSNVFTTESTIVKDKSVLIVEGVYAFFLQNSDYHIFMARTYKDTLERRKSRSRETYDDFVEQVLEIEHQLVAGQHVMADIIIAKDYSVGYSNSSTI